MNRIWLGWSLVLMLTGCMSPDGVAQQVDRRTEALRGEAVCLLEYNTALVPGNTDPCCKREGEENACDKKKPCNERSGGGCCVIYATQATAGGQGCCFYEDNGTAFTGPGVERTQECNELMTR